MKTAIANYGIFRRATKTALGDLPESIVTYEPDKEAAEEMVKGLNKTRDLYFVHPIDEFLNKVPDENPLV